MYLPAAYFRHYSSAAWLREVEINLVYPHGPGIPKSNVFAPTSVETAYSSAEVLVNAAFSSSEVSVDAAFSSSEVTVDAAFSSLEGPDDASFSLKEAAILDMIYVAGIRKTGSDEKIGKSFVEADEYVERSSYSGNSAEIKITIIQSQAIHFPTALILQIAKRSSARHILWAALSNLGNDLSLTNTGGNRAASLLVAVMPRRIR